MLRKLERKLRPYAIANLTIYIVIAQVMVYMLSVAEPQLFSQLVFVPSLVLDGEVWRLFTFAVMPPLTNPIFLFFALYLFWMMGTALEREWGEFRYNLYLLIGYLATVVSAMVPELLFNMPVGEATNVYILGSVFLAFAYLFPDFQILLFFILPVRVKWIALAMWVLLGINAAGALFSGQWLALALVIASVLNFLIFFGRDLRRRTPGALKKAYKTVKPQYVGDEPAPGQAFHTCEACGATDADHPDREFRYFPTPDGVKCLCDQCARQQGLMHNGTPSQS